MCTGYDLVIEFFEEEILNWLDYDKIGFGSPYLLYKFTFSPFIENMAMVCLILFILNKI